MDSSPSRRSSSGWSSWGSKCNRRDSSYAARVLLALLFAMTATDSASLIRGNTSLAIDLYRLQATASRENIFFSPYSISTAMAMADAGARGTTAAEIEKAMHLPFGGTKLAGSSAALHNDINRTREGITLLTANALWAAKDIEVKPEYLSLARKDFGAKVETLDFAKSEAARKHIN